MWASACVALLAVVPGLRAEDRFFDSNGVKIRYRDQGQGEPVLLIHGFGANLDMQWVVSGAAKTLVKDYRVIAFDCRGHGKSGKPHDPKQYGMEMVEDAVRLLDHLGIKKAHVVGYSMGAMITAKLLVTHADRLLSATLGGAGSMTQDKRVLHFTDQLADSLDHGKGIDPLIQALAPPGRPRPSSAEVQLINKIFTALNDPKALAAMVRTWKDLAVSDAELKANRVPVLAVIGADDPLKLGVDHLQGRLAGLKIVVIPRADHITTFARPEFLRAVQAFLAEHPAATKEPAK
jgi:pimeloyl-ACP methyl ester carboxylesterase